ncbi:uncharacterized protein [Coffea arabica]|uniref:Aminotransferase-like plant mobile domain-containing protein n=1 Tax=Coffea arabica TaxID=13443 RepID=A0A6P6SBK8_COFAR
MEEQPSDAVMEEREELMVPPTGGKPTLRTAYFLKPTDHRTFVEKNGLSSVPRASNVMVPINSKESPLRVVFGGWKCRQPREWKNWVHQLRPAYEDTWKKAGILEAILASTYHTTRDNDLIVKLAEKWCLETNTFVFSWGEATITLEDVMVLGGYQSVLGDCALGPLACTEGMFNLEEKLKRAHSMISRSMGQFARQRPWIRHFKGTGKKLEHEAFLALWLSRYVFPNYYDFVSKNVFPVAISLSRGFPVAVAPSLLASIYRDMGLLKKFLIASVECPDSKSKLYLSAPLQLVQLWAWERFPTLRPNPNPLEFGEPRSARWHMLKKVGVKDVREALDSACESFQWRPYAIAVENWNIPRFYKENEDYVTVDSGKDLVMESWVRCLRISELVGMDCLELYLPHRVAMQFGFDQDVPGFVKRSSNCQPLEIAWSNYNRPIKDVKLHIPARLFESDVTTRYLEWWDKLKLDQGNATTITNVVLPGLSPNPDHVGQEVDDDDDDNIMLAELMKRKRGRADEAIGVSGGFEIMADAQGLSPAPENRVSVKNPESGINSVTSGDENVGRVLEEYRTDNSNAIIVKERLMNTEEDEEESYKSSAGDPLEPKIGTLDNESVAGGASQSGYAEINEQSGALPERLNWNIEVENLEARIRNLGKILAWIQAAEGEAGRK